MDADGTNQTNISNKSGNDIIPSWSLMVLKLHLILIEMAIGKYM